MIELLEDQVEKKAKEVISYVREKDVNEYDYNLIRQYGEWYAELIADHIAIRERCIKMANDLSPEGTSETAVTKKAEEYYKFILNN